MTLATQIKNRIKRIPKGRTFGYSDLRISKDEYQTAAKALERLQSKGVIKKVSKGVFFRPEKSIFGELSPMEYEILRLYLFENGKRVAYITGYSLYNSMRLTTQMAFRLQIASRSKRIVINKGSLKVVSVKSYADVTDSNYKLLGLLDAIKDIKRIPDTTVSKSVRILSGIIKELNESQISELTKYALLYPPRARALLGAILENLGIQANLAKLKASLNPLTKIKLILNDKDLPTKNNWYIA